MYLNDKEIMTYSQTQQQLVDKIAAGPQQQDLLYIARHEEDHYQKRQQTKMIAVQMSDAARDHKGKQDELLRKNAQMRD